MHFVCWNSGDGAEQGETQQVYVATDASTSMRKHIQTTYHVLHVNVLANATWILIIKLCCSYSIFY